MTKEELEKTIIDTATPILKTVVDTYMKDQLKEQLADVTTKLKAELKPVIEVEKPKDEKKFKGFGDFLTSVRNFRMNRQLDERLQYVPGVVGKTTGHMEIGDDAQGGYSELMLA